MSLVARSCGSCTMCCTLTYVPELKKPERVTCEHCDAGCNIYENRPQSCAKYECAWIAGEMGEDMRPDNSGVLVERHPLMIAALLKDETTLASLPSSTLAELEKFVKEGIPVIATGQFAKLPKGMKPEEAKRRLLQTIRDTRSA